MTPLAAPPPGPVPVPAAVRRAAGADAVAPVWRNELGGLTFRLLAHDGTARFAKWSPASAGIDLAAEAARLRWASPWTPVPEVLDLSDDADGAQLLVTRGLPGRSAVDPRWLAEPATAARALGEGLRSLHDALPADACPFDWGVEARLARLRPDVRPEVRAALADAPDVERAVVCHGDACAPNTLLADDGRWTAHVDLGTLGVADPWADLAVAAMSTGWNYGPGYEGAVYEAYGVEPDAERIAYYRMLWDAG